MARRAARAGSRLHTRLVVLFSLVAAIPALFTAAIAAVSVEWAINPAFMRNVAAFINESGASSQLYRESQCQSLLRDADLIAGDLSRASPLLTDHREVYQNLLDSRARALSFTVAAIVTTEGETTIASADSDKTMIAKPGARDFADADAKQPFCGLLGNGGAFIALRPVASMPGSYFYAGRATDPLADQVGRDALQVTAAFANFEAHRLNIELGFAAVFIMLSATLLISAVWTGLTFANRLVSPIRRLIRAADTVAQGDFSIRVPTKKSDGDLAHLGESFNSMTDRIAPAAREPRRRQPAQRGAPRLHRGGARRRARRDRRRRQERLHPRLQLRRRAAVRGDGRRADGKAGRRGVPRPRPDPRRRRRFARARASGAGDA